MLGPWQIQFYNTYFHKFFFNQAFLFLSLQVNRIVENNPFSIIGKLFVFLNKWTKKFVLWWQEKE